MEATRQRTEVDGMSATQMQQAINQAVREATEELRSEVQALREQLQEQRRAKRPKRVSTSASCAQVEPTPGPYRSGVTSARDRVILTVHRDDGKAHGDLYSVRHPVEAQEPVANLQLTEKAFTVAQKAGDMGYDPLSAVEGLPQLIEAAEEGSYSKVRAVLAAMKDRA